MIFFTHSLSCITHNLGTPLLAAFQTYLVPVIPHWFYCYHFFPTLGATEELPVSSHKKQYTGVGLNVATESFFFFTSNSTLKHL